MIEEKFKSDIAGLYVYSFIFMTTIFNFRVLKYRLNRIYFLTNLYYIC